MIEYLKGPPPTAVPDDAVKLRVEDMLRRIERGGIDAVRRYSRELDDWAPRDFVLAPEEVARLQSRVDEALLEHVEFAQGQVRAFAAAQRGTLTDLEVEIGPGVTLGHRHIPVSAVGAYVPGGRYPMLASSFMTVLVAKVAGVPHVVGCAPPQRAAGAHPAMVHAMATSGADRIVCLGGVQALAALAFGLLDGVGRVDMLVGAGNAYVAEAKRQLFGRVGIDLLAGPTEILVIADATTDPELAAADLLGQAEHGPDSPVGLIATDAATARAITAELERLLTGWPTAAVAGRAWRDHGWVAVVGSDAEAVALADEVAAEHLEVQVDEARLDYYHGALRSYGSLFLGREATVAHGDKAVGTNHVLPTRRGARYTGGLWVGKFLKTVTYQRLSEQGTRTVGPATAAISHAEGFAGHARTVELRLERLAGEVGEPA